MLRGPENTQNYEIIYSIEKATFLEKLKIHNEMLSEAVGALPVCSPELVSTFGRNESFWDGPGGEIVEAVPNINSQFWLLTDPKN